MQLTSGVFRRVSANLTQLKVETNEVQFPQLVMADVVDKDSMKNYSIASEKINPGASRYPYCIVWTPIPVLS